LSEAGALEALEAMRQIPSHLRRDRGRKGIGGRPSGRVHTKEMYIRFSPTQIDLLRARARALNCSMSAVVRAAVDRMMAGSGQ